MDAAAMETPAKGVEVSAVDITAIEQHKENIQPLTSGRSASQLASLSSHTRSGLGAKLAQEHKLFQARLDAIDVYEQTGQYSQQQQDATANQNVAQASSGVPLLTLEDVQHMADDPLDVHHQYARFVVGNYPAGASATSRLVPLLEHATRKFVDDPRYTNDPRYLRLWNLYAKHTDAPEDCYRFLFAKGIGDKLASLYEEFALVLEQAGRRREADKVYTLGIHRFAMPLDRLKRRHREFQERMLHAPQASSPPKASTRTDHTMSSTAGAEAPIVRPVLGGGVLAAATSGPLSKTPGNGGSSFAIFRDTASSQGQHAEEAQWDDLGTVKSRKRENEIEAKEWKGETLPMHSASKPSAFKLEVFRDSDSALPPATSTPADATGDVFTRSLRGPSEVETLRKNPFRNFSPKDRELAAVDPLAGLDSLPTLTTAASINAVPAKASSKSSTSFSSKKSKSREKERTPAPKPTSERTAVDLAAVYPEPGVEYSFEELRMRRRAERMGESVDGWRAWEHRDAWKAEVDQIGRTSYIIDEVTSFPLLHHPQTKEPLFEFVAQMDRAATRELDAAPAVERSTDTPTRGTPTTQAHSLLSPSPVRPQATASVVPPTVTASPLQDTEVHLIEPLSPSPSRPAESMDRTSPERSPLPSRRAPSPTINTRLAANFIDEMFAKTLPFGNGDGARRSDDDDDDDESEPSTEDEEEERAAWADIPHSQLNHGSQLSQATTIAGSQDDPPFVPFSQSESQIDDSMFQPSQHSQLSDVQERSEEDDGSVSQTVFDVENRPSALSVASKVPPMQLFRDPTTTATTTAQAGATPATPGFRPVKRAPLSTKPLGGLGLANGKHSIGAGLNLFNDGESVLEEERDEDDRDGLSEYEAPLREERPLGNDDDEDEDAEFESRPPMGDGFAMGRREKGVPSRYAPFIDAMTPVKEATMEYTSGYTMSSLSASQRSRRESAFASKSATVEEEDEDDSEEEDDDDNDGEDGNDDAGDRAFVAYEAEDESDRSSFQTRRDSDSEEDDDADETGPAVGIPLRMTEPGSSRDIRESTRGDSRSDTATGDASTAHSISAIERSFDVSVNTSLPEGLTITGNQSGMMTNMVVAETTTVSPTGSRPEPVNPFSASTIKALLAASAPPVLQHAKVRNFTDLEAGNLSSLQKTAKRRHSRSGKDKTGVIEDAWEIKLGQDVFSVREKLGEGTFGAVFRMAAPQDPDASFDVDAIDDEASLAVKIERPANLWEFVALDKLHSRLPERARQAVVKADKLYVFKDESYLMLEYCDQGSLLDAVNKANESGVAPPTGGVAQGLDELVAMFFVVELLRVVEDMHRAGFVHGDLKIDNCLVRFEDVPGGTRAWSSTYDPSGAGGWSSKGVKLIDFGRTIDTTVFPPGQSFKADLKPATTTTTPDEAVAQQQALADCPEMRSGDTTWTFEPDYYGLASIAFNLLFGRYMETKLVDAVDAGDDDNGEENNSVPRRPRWRINQNFRRYHQADLWTRLFDTLLNPRDVRPDAALPITDELADVRREMQRWLERNCDRNGKSLKSLIKKMEIFAMAR